MISAKKPMHQFKPAEPLILENN